jgi:hypothetical protein
MNNGSRAECSHGGGEAVAGQDDSRASEQWKCAFVLSTVDGGLHHNTSVEDADREGGGERMVKDITRRCILSS